MRRLLCTLGFVSACGMGGDGGGGLENLPIAATGPYRKIYDATLTTPVEEPYVVVDRMANLTDPTAIALSEESFRLWFTRTRTAGGAVEIWTTRLPALDRPAEPPVLALAPDAAWEGSEVRAPAVIDHDDQLVMFYAAAGGIGRAVSADDGVTWIKDPAPVLPDAGSPSAVVADGHWFLYVTRPGMSGIFLAESDDGMSFVLSDTPVLDRRDTVLGAFDRSEVLEPSAVGGISSVGVLRVGLLYTGRDPEGQHQIGYAGSENGKDFTRFQGTPVLAEGGIDERGPGCVLVTARAILFYTETRAGVQAIAAATAP